MVLDIHTSNKLRAALACLCALFLAACDLGVGAQPSPPDTVTPTRLSDPTPVTIARTTPAESTMTAPAIIDFKVYQDFMPMVPSSGPPLHASLTLEINVKAGRPANDPGGTITITRPTGELIATAPLTQTRQADDLGLRYLGPQQIVMSTPGIAISAKLTEGETLQGSATITLGGISFDLKLPPAQVLFTH